MTYHDEVRCEAGIVGRDAAVGLGYSDGISLARLGPPNSADSIFGERAPQLFALAIDGAPLDSRDTLPVEIVAEDTAGADLASVTFEVSNAEAHIRGRVSLMDRHRGPIEIVLQIGIEWSSGVPREVTVVLPFLAAAARGGNYLRPGDPPGVPGPSAVSRYTFHEFPPAVLCDTESGAAFGFEFPDQFPLGQANCNNEIWRASAAADPGARPIAIRPVSQLTDIMALRLHASGTGRGGIFESWKETIRRTYDLRRYDLEGPQWYRKTYLHHFTYAYGRESYDYDRDVIDIAAVLRAGEEFGGYDALLYWHQYPRLGLDERTQWALYDDLPEGRESIRKMAALCHERSVRLFLPFKPWDVRPWESLDDQAAEIERLVAQTGVDGFFLDTMATTPESFSRLIRERFPGLMFCSEGRPIRIREIEQLTGSWDQIGAPTSVEVNLSRFVFPEHAQHMISRWSVGSDKDTLIRRAVFNGTGLVIWQDVFGAWLPYDADQKRRIRAWKQVLSRYHDVIFGQRSIPLIDTLAPGLLANRFAVDPADCQVVALFNSTDSVVSGPLLSIPEIPAARCRQLWGDHADIAVQSPVRSISSAGNAKCTTICGSMTPGAVIVIFVEPDA